MENQKMKRAVEAAKLDNRQMIVLTYYEGNQEHDIRILMTENTELTFYKADRGMGERNMICIQENICGILVQLMDDSTDFFHHIEIKRYAEVIEDDRI